MLAAAHTYQVERILSDLGFPDPLLAARQHARMILIGRLARYEAAMQHLASLWPGSIEDLQHAYQRQGQEDFAADDTYLEWKWYADAAEAVKAQLIILTAS